MPHATHLTTALLVFCASFWGPPAQAQDNLPPELEPWVDWVLEGHPNLNCPVTTQGTACIWPGELDLVLHGSGGTFELAVQTDRRIAVPLPGGQARWPQNVTVNGKDAVLTDKRGLPMTTLESGSHSVRGQFEWNSLPQSLPLPSTVGRVSLSINGKAVDQPAMDEQGLLRLGPGESKPASEERLNTEVSRHVTDGVPVRVDTQITLRASGSAREVTLGVVGVPGTRPVSLQADLPARFNADGALVVQVRPGTFTVEIESLHDGPVAELAPPALEEFWPEHEFWAITTNDQVRAIDLSGPPAVDPARTTLPEKWRGLSTFMVSSDVPLTFTELRRGEPEPAPNRLNLYREIWLDADGGGFTFRDRFDGDMQQEWRLSMMEPYDLGHAVTSSRDQVITRSPAGQAGVELRQSDLNLVAESRIEGRPSTLPAVGWDTDVNSLEATLRLSPGWSLLAATGVDQVPGSLLDDWDLFDLFFVLILALATGRLLGWRWAAVALVGLALSRQNHDAPVWAWVFLLTSVGLERVAQEGWPSMLSIAFRWTCTGALLLILVPFSVTEIRTGLFPVLENPWQSSTSSPSEFTSTPSQAIPDRNENSLHKHGYPEAPDEDIQYEIGNYPEAAPEGLADAFEGQKEEDLIARGSGDLGYGGRGIGGGGEYKVGLSGMKGLRSQHLSMQYDPSLVANTGAGVQQWNWSGAGGMPTLRWSGPVTSDHSVKLYLLSPLANGALHILQVLLLLALGLRMAGLRQLRPPTPSPIATRAATVLLAALMLPKAAQAAPDNHLLQELERRMTQAADCRRDCVTNPTLEFAVEGDRLVLSAEVHAAARSSWPVPGPAEAWVPDRVLLDGKPTTALARLSDGFLHIRLEPGVHELRVSGPLPPTDSTTLTLSQAPKKAQWVSNPDWSLDGLHSDATAERTVQLTRNLSRSADKSDDSTAENLAPWLMVTRTLDLGIPWRIRTEVQRVDGSDAPLSLQVPVLDGESVTDESLQVEDGKVRVSLDRNRDQVSWVSTLEEQDTIVLTAPEGVAWTENWVLSCSPMFSCTATGLDPLEHSQAGQWSPRWAPWPGESVTLAIAQPEAVPGQTITIDKARLDWTPGRRLGEGTLGVVIRSSQGGQQAITLPDGARLQKAMINGQERPLQARDNQVWVPLQPGAQSVLLSWQQTHEPALWTQVPTVDLGSPAVNVAVVLHASYERVILAVRGPGWGPVPLFWTYLLVLLLAAPLLARLPWVPLKTWQWLLLGMGMTQVPFICPLLVAVWFIVVGYRSEHAPKIGWVFNLSQLTIIGTTLIALGCLYASIHSGLLLQPDTQIRGNGSSAQELLWFADRIEGALPTPAVLSIPTWSWRVVMLLWALWLAASVLRWLPWTWKAFRKDGWFRPYVAPKKSNEAGAPPISSTPATPPEVNSDE
ncbi:MAG: hypothetical protein VX519_07035 [Myxococcota bacterium]|nr:hypothetical protein [Myxococcota bacterium]